MLQVQITKYAHKLITISKSRPKYYTGRLVLKKNVFSELVSKLNMGLINKG